MQHAKLASYLFQIIYFEKHQACEVQFLRFHLFVFCFLLLFDFFRFSFHFVNTKCNTHT
jgi:hypothetical protein